MRLITIDRHSPAITTTRLTPAKAGQLLDHPEILMTGEDRATLRDMANAPVASAIENLRAIARGESPIEKKES